MCSIRVGNQEVGAAGNSLCWCGEKTGFSWAALRLSFEFLLEILLFGRNNNADPNNKMAFVRKPLHNPIWQVSSG